MARTLTSCFSPEHALTRPARTMIEPHRGSPEFMVLHTLRCLGFASAQRVGAILEALAPIDVEDHLLSLATQGLVNHHPGEFGGWGVTDAGKMADAEQVLVELEQTGARDHVRAAYGDFVDLNQRALDIFGAWQLRTGGTTTSLNDHTDRAYDSRVLEQLAVLDAEARPLCARLSAHLYRFSHYRPRLASALARARSGDLDQVTDSLDSYHTVWFQLHEDLLVTLGTGREW